MSEGCMISFASIRRPFARHEPQGFQHAADARSIFRFRRHQWQAPHRLEQFHLRQRRFHRRYHPLMEINFVESNPIPVKAALAEMELLEPVWRLPLVPPKEENRARIRGVLESLGLVARDGASYVRERSHAALAH